MASSIWFVNKLGIYKNILTVCTYLYMHMLFSKCVLVNVVMAKYEKKTFRLEFLISGVYLAKQCRPDKILHS